MKIENSLTGKKHLQREDGANASIFSGIIVYPNVNKLYLQQLTPVNGKKKSKASALTGVKGISAMVVYITS